MQLIALFKKSLVFILWLSFFAKKNYFFTPPSMFSVRLKAAELLGKDGRIFSILHRKRKSWEAVCADEFLTVNACCHWFIAMFIAIQQNYT
jgi:hypothetical protein